MEASVNIVYRIQQHMGIRPQRMFYLAQKNVQPGFFTETGRVDLKFTFVYVNHTVMSSLAEIRARLERRQSTNPEVIGALSNRRKSIFQNGQ